MTTIDLNPAAWRATVFEQARYFRSSEGECVRRRFEEDTEGTNRDFAWLDAQYESGMLRKHADEYVAVFDVIQGHGATARLAREMAVEALGESPRRGFVIEYVDPNAFV